MCNIRVEVAPPPHSLYEISVRGGRFKLSSKVFDITIEVIAALEMSVVPLGHKGSYSSE